MKRKQSESAILKFFQDNRKARDVIEKACDQIGPRTSVPAVLNGLLQVYKNVATHYKYLHQSPQVLRGLADDIEAENEWREKKKLERSLAS